MNEATNLMSSLGVKSVDQKRMEMAGAMTRMIYNQVVVEAKERAKVRDATMAAPTEGVIPTSNG